MYGLFLGNMRIIILLSAALISAAQNTPPSRSVNVALETSFLFDPKDLDDNKKFVNNVRSFLDKLCNIFEPTANHIQNFRTETKHIELEAETKQREPEAETKRREPEAETKKRKSEEVVKFTDLFKFVKSIENNNVNMTGHMKKTVNTIHVEGDNGQAKVEEVQPLTDIKKNITEWIKSNVEEINKMINITITGDNPLMKTVVRRMNNYYDDEELKKFNKTVKKMKRYLKNGRDTSKLVDDLLHSAIYEKYNSLNETSKTALMGDIMLLSDVLSENNIFKGLSRTLKVLSRRSSRGQVNSDSAELHDNVDLTYNSLKSSIDKNLKAAREKKDFKNKGAINQVVVDNVELFVEPSQK